MSEGNLTIEPVPSLYEFFTSEKFISLVVGPVGSTKTSAALAKIAYHASRMAPCLDGVRRSRCVWVRNTREQLRDTSIPDFLKWYRDGVAGDFFKTEYKFILRFDNVECEVLFRGLDDADDVRRLLSLQASFAVLEEFREQNKDIFEALQGRLGRYPDGMMVPHRPEWGVDKKGHPVQGCVTDEGTSNAHLWGASNPPDMDTFWETFLSNPPENTHITIQPSGLSAEADWLQYLPPDYYDNLAQGKSQDYIDVYIHAKFGKSLSGRAVHTSFNRDIHVAKSEILVQTAVSTPLLIGADAGLSPAVTIGQVDYQGRVLVYHAIPSEGMGALRFIREKLKPVLANRFPGRPSVVLVDPAAFQRAQTDERTVADIYKAEGFMVRPAATTNALPARLGAVDALLSKLVDGKPGILFCPVHAGPIIQALAGKYRYRVTSKGVTEVSPEKSHPWSDLCFVAGTPVLTPKGYVPIETLRPGMEVCVPDGVDVVTHTSDRVVDETCTLTLNDGTLLTCTPDHPFATGDKTHPCFTPANTLGYEDAIVSVEDGEWASGRYRTRQSGLSNVFARSVALVSRHLRGVSGRVKASIARLLAGTAGSAETASRLTGCGSGGTERTDTSGTNGPTGPLCHSTGTCGSESMGRCRTDIRCTTSTETRQTTTSGTWSASSQLTMHECTCVSGSKTEPWTRRPRCAQHEKQQKPGTDRTKGESGTVRTHGTQTLRVVRKDFRSGAARVFNLTTERTHVFYAGAALVHNCDSLQYLCLNAGGAELVGANHVVVAQAVETVSAGGWT